MNTGYEAQQNSQERIVAFLAEKSHLPLADVASLYEHERAKLALEAHITKFLHIFAIRNVEEIFRQQAHQQRGTLAESV